MRPDGKQFSLGNADGTITLARVSDGEVEQTLKDSDAFAVLTLSYRPDGAMIAAAGADGTIRLWDIAEGKKTSAWPAGQGEVRAVAFHPDGQWLAMRAVMCGCGKRTPGNCCCTPRGPPSRCAICASRPTAAGC